MAQLVLKNILAGSGNVLAGGDDTGNVTKVTIGSNLTLSGGVLSATGGGTGSVTSVALSRSGNALTITGSPITTAGTINIGFSGNSGQYIDGSGNLTTFPSIITQAQNLVTEVYNETGATLTKGTVVYINGGHGNLPTVTKAIATSDATSAQTYGIVRANITNNNNGYVTVIGNLDNMDTQAYPNGTQLYLSSTIAGAYTSVKQYAPAHLVYVGIVTRSHPTQGVIEVKIQNGFEMDELHNVSAQSPVNGSILQYSTSTSLWNAVAGTTTNIAEGDNLYFTNARARGVLSTNVGSALSYNSTTGRFTLVAAESGIDGYLTGTDYDYFDSKQNSLGTGTTSEFLRGDLVWATPPTPNLGDLGDVAITTPTNGQVLTYRVGTWKNETPAAAPVLSVFGRTGIIVATSGDYTTDQVTEATNLYYTNARARGSVSVDVGSALTYNSTTGRFSLPAADGGVDGYVTTTDYNYWDSKQDSLGTGTTAQYLRGDLTWSTPPAPALDDLTDVTITSPTNGQLLRYQAGTWINFTPTYVVAGFFSATAPLSYNSTTGVFSISQATTSTNGYLSSTDWNTFNNKQSALTNPVTGTGTTGKIARFSGTSTLEDSYITDTANTATTIEKNSSSITAPILRVVPVSPYTNASILNLDNAGAGSFYVGRQNSAGNSDLISSLSTYDSVIGHTGGQTLHLITNATSRLAVFGSGNLGIATTTDAGFKLDVNGTFRTSAAATFSSSIFFPNGSISTTGELSFNSSSPNIYTYGRYAGTNGGRIIFNNGTGANMFFGEIATHIYGFTSNAYTTTPALSINLNATKVGIGISNPGYLLTLYEATLPQIAFQNSGAVRAIIGADSGSLALNSLTSSPITFNVDSVERVRLTSTGNLGIGTTAPASKLEVYKTDGSYNLYTRINLDVSTDLFAKVYMGSGLTGGYIGYDEAGSERLVLNAANSTATMQFLIAGSEKMRLTSAGYFGINTTTPTYPLEVSGVSFFNGGFNLASTVKCRWGGNNTPSLGFPFGGSDTGNALFIEAADSDTGGIAICNDGVTVYGAADTGFVFRAIDEDSYQSGVGLAAATTFQVNQGTNGGGYIRGDWYVYSGSAYATAFFESSDKRLKKELNDNPIVNGISDIKPKLYIKDGKEELGYYAQDLEQILPSAVTEGKDGFLALSYSQVLVAKVANLEGEVKELKEIVKTLINELGRNK